jgi:O-methyltransferase involved in polyketide biosynthesis
LWTLHNRASEAARPDGLIRDPDAVAIRDAIDFDYVRHFGHADGSHAQRSVLVDAALQEWLQTHPAGQVVELACGLETQVRRCDNGRVRWLAMDLPEVMVLREHFLPSGGRVRHFTGSVTDPRWMEAVDASGPVFITAQGLLMYLPPDTVQRLLGAIDRQFRDYRLVFDTIPPWFSRRTLRGFQVTRNYTAPPMPWGVPASRLPLILAEWMPRSGGVRLAVYGPMRGWRGRVVAAMAGIPTLADLLPCVATVGTAGWRTSNANGLHLP